MIATVQFKRCVAGASVFCIIIGKFSHQKEFCLVVLLKFDKSSEVGFHYAIVSLGLIVFLKMKYD